MWNENYYKNKNDQMHWQQNENALTLKSYKAQQLTDFDFSNLRVYEFPLFVSNDGMYKSYWQLQNALCFLHSSMIYRHMDFKF